VVSVMQMGRGGRRRKALNVVVGLCVRMSQGKQGEEEEESGGEDMYGADIYIKRRSGQWVQSPVGRGECHKCLICEGYKGDPIG
jgi:hypothetical protein